MNRAVFDTNVVVSGLLWSGAPQQIFALAQANKLQIITSEILLDELRDVLHRSKFAKRLEKLGKTSDTLLESFLKVAHIVTAAEITSGAVADPDDEAVLACAVGGEADFIVSGDQHLLILGKFANIEIVTPAQLLAQIAMDKS